VPGTQTGLTHIPLAVFGWRTAAKGEHQPDGLRGESTASQQPGGMEKGSSLPHGALQTPGRDALPELADNQKCCFSWEEGGKSMIGKSVGLLHIRSAQMLRIFCSAGNLNGFILDVVKWSISC